MTHLVRILVATNLLGAAVAHGQYSISVDILSPGEEGYDGVPSSLVCIDVYSRYPNNDHWLWGGIRGLALAGAQLRYAPDPNDPAIPRLYDPGPEHRYTTFLSRPRPRNGIARFTNSAVYPYGAYDPPQPALIASPTEINVAYVASPPQDKHLEVPGYVARIALDISNVIDHPPEIDGWNAGPLTAAPSDAVFVYRSEPAADGTALFGTANETEDAHDGFGLDWGVWFVPEPSAIVLLLAGACFARILHRRPD